MDADILTRYKVPRIFEADETKSDNIRARHMFADE